MSSRKKPMVRIVDDDKDLRQTLEYLLQTAGWETVSYESAEDYLAQDARSIPGCLILDVRMGGMSGLEMQQRLTTEGATVPIIFSRLMET